MRQSHMRVCIQQADRDVQKQQPPHSTTTSLFTCVCVHVCESKNGAVSRPVASENKKQLSRSKTTSSFTHTHTHTQKTSQQQQLRLCICASCQWIKKWQPGS